ncbi:Uncharacterised protein [Helicobacter cholecystus]|uniref:hypothetical protein n=1 Tax=Helicobacter cholecystus TaxID=45498 RepID=UPI000CF0DB4E|nr:hypothetical protein [Helicobacter cholecystus]VEJ24665.1 Uncharacterised protein [Helicobacter cholecystus]
MDMKKTSMAFLASCLTLSAYDNIDEALKNGIAKGDVGFFTDYYDPFATHIANDFEMKDESYVALTMGLQYRSAFYKNMRLSVGFRAAYPLWQWHKGDINLDFDSSNPILLNNTFLEYFDGDTSVKIGRFFLENEWTCNQVDGFWVRNASLENLLLEMYWINAYGDVTSTLMSAFTRYNPNWSGLTHAAAKYNFTIKDWMLWAKLYTGFAYSVNYILGGGTGLEYKFGESKLGLSLNTAGSFEFSNGESGGNGVDFNMEFYVEGGGIKFNLGYIQTGKEVGWGSLDRINNTISPLGVENVLDSSYALNTSVIYTGISGEFNEVILGILYGVGLFTSPLVGGRHIQNEVNLALEVNFTNNVTMFANFYNTHLGNDAIPNVIQVQGGLTLSF